MKTLVSVDVQFEYCNHFDEVYLRALEAYLSSYRNQYDRVIVVYSDPDATDFDRGRRHPEFLTSTADTFIEKWFYSVDDDWLQSESFVPVEGTQYYTDPHGNLALWVSNQYHQDYFVSPYVLTELAKSTTSADFIGGARYQCLEDVIATFKYFNVLVNVIEPLTYQLEWLQSSIEDVARRFETYPWTAIPMAKDHRI